ncbi:MAG: hypothetical protein O3C27_08155 [Actinomycetota bacterium]|nr:hypothetical protein [Actinomycetota bacterium]
MKRNLIQVARIRMEEVLPGDVVNRVPDDTRGWFIVAAIELLFDGTLQVTDSKRHAAFSAGPLDIVGVQLLKPIEPEVTEDPGVLTDALGGTHDAAIDKAAGSDGGAEATEMEQVAEPVAVPPSLHAPTPRPAAIPVPAPAAAPAARRTMRSLVEP